MTLKVCRDCAYQTIFGLGSLTPMCQAPELRDQYTDVVTGEVRQVSPDIAVCSFQRTDPSPFANANAMAPRLKICGREGRWFKQKP